MNIEVTAEWIAKMESYVRDNPNYAPSRLSTLALIAKLREVEEDAKASSEAVKHWIEHGTNMAAERDALTAKMEEAKEALKQAQSCILNETPEDMSHEEARADTLEKIHKVLWTCLTAKPAKVEQPGEWRTLVAPSRPTQALFAKLREAEAERSALAAKLAEAKEALLHAREFVDEEMELRASAGGDESVREYAEAPRVTLAKIDAALSRLTAEPAKGGEA